MIKNLPSDAFYYDPDFRKSHIHPKDWKKPYCVRCMQNLDTSKAIPITHNSETWMAVVGHDRIEEIRTNYNHDDLTLNGWIGKDCYKKVKQP